MVYTHQHKSKETNGSARDRFNRPKGLATYKWWEVLQVSSKMLQTRMVMPFVTDKSTFIQQKLVLSDKSGFCQHKLPLSRQNLLLLPKVTFFDKSNSCFAFVNNRDSDEFCPT